MVSKRSIKELDKVRCKRPKSEDARFEHEYIGLVIKKYERSALVIIAINHPDDDLAMLVAHGKTIIPYSDMTKINSDILFFDRSLFFKEANKRERQNFGKHVNVMNGMAVVFEDEADEGIIESYRFAGVDCQLKPIKREWCTINKEMRPII